MQDGSTSATHLAMEEKALDSGSRHGGRRGRGGGGGGGGRGQGREVQVSRAMSKLLRHQADNAGIRLDAEGFAPLDQVVSLDHDLQNWNAILMNLQLAWGPLRSLNVTFSDVQSVVTTNDKQRFALKPNPATNATLSTESTDPADYLIRANQGHSIKIESSALLTPITLEEGNIPAKVLHGTYFAFWSAIEQSGGLRPMGRNHVHCSTGTPDEGVVSGMRRDAELVIEIDVVGSLREGVKWWRSDNDVVLTEGGEDGLVSSRFFKLVTGRTVDVGVLWKDGEHIADLPKDLKMRIPQGKRRGNGRRGRGR